MPGVWQTSRTREPEGEDPFIPVQGKTWARMLPPDFSTAEDRHSIFDTLASMETSEGDVDKAFITVVECSFLY